MRHIYYPILFFILLFGSITLGQNYSGPLQGDISGGVVTNTDNFMRIGPIGNPAPMVPRNEFEVEFDEKYVNFPFPDPEVGSNYYEDQGAVNYGLSGQPVILHSQDGIGETNSIPPDPYVAVGPNHIIATVNSRFAIWDKEGNLLKNISADSWYDNLGNYGPFDPKITYDVIDDRWIMTWLHQNDGAQESYILLSVSDDDNPIGEWYSWAFPGDRIGNNEVPNWSDYQGVGYDEDAIYITSNQFGFDGFFDYGKLRIIPKAQLYNNTAGPANWWDIWSIGYPPGASGLVFTIRPSIEYTPSDEYYLIHAPNSSANFFSLFKITNPLTNPELTGVNVSVTPYSRAPNADQLGGSNIPIEGGGSAVRFEPTFRDGYLWAVHSIQNPDHPQNSSVRYVKIDVNTEDAVEDAALGADGQWYIYNALAVDQNHNIAITYSRSAEDEYIGAFFTPRYNDEPPGLRSSYLLREGEGNYVKDYGSGRNRWGDYNGAWLDPANEENFWFFTEYVAATNTWGTWLSEVRLSPYTGAHVFTSKSSLDFGNVEVGHGSDTLSIILSNYGEDDLTVTNIPETFGPFELVSEFTFPLTLPSYDSVDVNFAFFPDTPGEFEEVYPIESNDANFDGLTMSGKGYVLNPAAENVLYSTAGANSDGNVYLIDPATGDASLLGSSLFPSVRSLTISPDSNKIYGLTAGSESSTIIRMNAADGDAYMLYEFDIANLSGIAFDTTGQLYAAARGGDFYFIDLELGEYQLLFNAGINIADITFDTETNQMWASRYVVIGAGKDEIYTVDLDNETVNLVGSTGLVQTNNGIAFDKNGTLFAVIGLASQESDFISINTATGEGTLIGSTGITDLQGLAIAPDATVGVEDDESTLPDVYNLSQNYPNPFNPSTTIEFALPKQADVKLTIYNILGEVVTTLIDHQMSAGYHSLNWDASNLSSGIYFYEIQAEGYDGSVFNNLKKMILLK